MAKMVIALGGNALGNTPGEQLEAVKSTAASIVDLVEEGHEVVLAHGNGPQVGMINLAFETAAAEKGEVSIMPFPECGAMSQGYIGYHLQNAIDKEVNSRNMKKTVSTIITQVVVDKDDPAFSEPSKPVGSFYDRETAEEMKKRKDYVMKKDGNRGYRRVVPSPRPVDIVEKDVIKSLADEGQIVIACGGGGIPVVEEDNSLKGVPAVIDKDYASEKLAEILGASLLVILTAVEKVAINFGTVNEEWLSGMDVDTALRYCQEGHFAEGSMLPKVKAAIEFARAAEGNKTIITSLNRAREALAGKTGTIIKDT